MLDVVHCMLTSRIERKTHKIWATLLHFFWLLPQIHAEVGACGLGDELHRSMSSMAVDSLAAQEHQQVLDLLGSLPFLQRLPGASFQQIVQRAQLRHFGVDEFVVREDEPSEGLHKI
jgi:hypothetical protein